MSLLPLGRWSTRHYEEQTGKLPAPGPFPAARRPLGATVIFVVVLVVVVWLLDRGYSADAAVGTVAGAGAVAGAIASRLAGTQPADGYGSGLE
jgi:hypothetical protein